MKKILLLPFLLLSTSLIAVSCSGNNGSMQSSSISYKRNSVVWYEPELRHITEDDIEKVTYVAKPHQYQTDYSFGDYLTTYVSSSREDIINTLSYLRTSRIEVSNSNLYPEERATASVTFTVTLKNGKDLVIYGTDSHEFGHIYFDTNIVHIVDYNDKEYSVLTTRFFLSAPLPIMSNNLGYTFPDQSFKNCIVRDQEKAETINNTKADLLSNAVFTDDIFPVSDVYNEYNRYTICNDYDSSVLIFENSKQFRIFAGIGVRNEIGRYRITNDVSFDELSIK